MFVTIAWEDADGGLGIGGFEDGPTDRGLYRRQPGWFWVGSQMAKVR